MLNSMLASNLDGIDTRIPQRFLLVIMMVCVLSFAFAFLSIDSDARGTPVDHLWAIDTPEFELIDTRFQSLSGAFIYGLPELIIFSVVIIGAFFSFSHYKVTNEVIIPLSEWLSLCLLAWMPFMLWWQFWNLVLSELFLNNTASRFFISENGIGTSFNIGLIEFMDIDKREGI